MGATNNCNRNHLCYFTIFLFSWIFAIQSSIAQQLVYIDTVGYTCATHFNVAVRSKNLNNLVAMQGTISWDTAIIQFDGLASGTSSVKLDSTNMNFNNAVNGQLILLWFDNSLEGQAATNDSSLFVMKFNRNGIGKGTAAISFTSSPTPLEVDTIGTNGVPNKNGSAIFENGFVKTPSNYTFTGNGNWDIVSNWLGNNKPPQILPSCSEIIIDPDVNGECVLNDFQKISSGGTLTVSSGKKLRITSNIVIVK